MNTPIKDSVKVSKSPEEFIQKNDLVANYKSGDFERALKKHGSYVFAKRESTDDILIDLCAGDTWQGVLDAHAYIKDPSEREIELFQIIQKEIEGQKSRTIDFALIHTEPAIDAGVLLICFEILLKHGQLEEALHIIFNAKSTKMYLKFSQYVLSERISKQLFESLSEELQRQIDLIKVELATPSYLIAIAKHAETLVKIASDRLKPEILALLIAIESRIVNHSNKLIPKSQGKNCFLVFAENEGYWGRTFQLISDRHQLGFLASFIGRREKYLPKNVSLQLEMIKIAADLGLGDLVKNEKLWNGLNIGHFSRVGALVKKSDFVTEYFTTAKKLTSDSMQKLSLGGFLQIVDTFPEFKKVSAHPVLRQQILDFARRKRGVSAEIIKDLSNELVAQAVDVAQRQVTIELTKLEEEAASLNTRLIERGNHIDQLVAEIESLKERLRNAGKSELIARDAQLRQAQLQALRGLCELFEEVRIFTAALDVQFAKSGLILSKNAFRILENFGISMLGLESERLEIDRNLFKVTGSTSLANGTVVTPAYFVNSESGVEVLIRGYHDRLLVWGTMKRIIGIDFGTSTTLVAVRDGLDSAPQILPLGTGADPWVPSLIAQTDPIVVGESAESSPPELQVRSIKSGLTRGKEWQDTQLLDLNDDQVGEYVKAILAEVIKRAASKKSDLFIDAKVYLGCPALWSFGNRKILADIANELGLDVDVLDILDEPVAAGVQWIKSEWRDGTQGLELSGKTLIFDAGGGTLDVALLEVSGTENPEISVLSADSLARSGDDIDNSIVAHLIEEDKSLVINSQNQILMSNAARRLKEILSKDLSANVQVAFPVGKSFALTRGKLEELVEEQVLESLSLVERVLRQSLLRADSATSTATIRSTKLEEIAKEVKHVVLVGGLFANANFYQSTPANIQVCNYYSDISTAAICRRGSDICQYGHPSEYATPTLSFVMKPIRTDGDVVVLYEAFGEIVNHWEALQGNSLLGHTADLRSLIDGVYEITCVLPNRERTEIPIVINHGFTQEECTSIRVEHNSRLENEKVFFKLYATGEFVISGKGTYLHLRAKTWGRLRSGRELIEPLKADVVAPTFAHDGRNDASAASSK